MSTLETESFLELTDFKIPYNKATYHEWNSRFPQTIQQKHNEARALLSDHCTPNKFHSISKAFIKLEKVSFGSTADGYTDSTPRLIQGQPVHQNVIFGPWMYQMGKHTKKIWDGTKLIHYTSGRNANELGTWFANAMMSFSDPAFILVDYTKFDSTVNHATRAFTDSICIRLGIKEHKPVYDALLTDSIQEGYTRHGVYYKTNDGTGSGRANTTIKNSIINAAIACTALTDHTQFKIAVNGDDSLIVGDRTYLESNFMNLTDYATELGFEPVARFTIHTHEVDYCSKIPYPAIHPLTKQPCIVFGPKLGKLLHKIGWNLDKQGVKSQPQVMRELMKSAKHIPFIYEFARKVNSRLSNRKFKHVDDPSYWDTDLAYDPDPAVWPLLLEPRYGATRQLLQEFLDVLDTMDDQPLQVIQFPAILRWCEIDDLM